MSSAGRCRGFVRHRSLQDGAPRAWARRLGGCAVCRAVLPTLVLGAVLSSAQWRCVAASTATSGVRFVRSAERCCGTCGALRRRSCAMGASLRSRPGVRRTWRASRRGSAGAVGDLCGFGLPVDCFPGAPDRRTCSPPGADGRERRAGGFPSAAGEVPARTCRVQPVLMAVRRAAWVSAGWRSRAASMNGATQAAISAPDNAVR